MLACHNLRRIYSKGNGGNRRWPKRHVIGQKHDDFFILFIPDLQPPQGTGILVMRLKSFNLYDLIAHDISVPGNGPVPVGKKASLQTGPSNWIPWRLARPGLHILFKRTLSSKKGVEFDQKCCSSYSSGCLLFRFFVFLSQRNFYLIVCTLSIFKFILDRCVLL